MSDQDRFTPAPGLRLAEIAIWGALAALLCGLLLAATGQQRLSNDGYQYLSVVDNLSAGHGVSTNLVHFDIERAHGTIPAPLTTFPAGFPVATTVFHAMGMASQSAGVAVSLFGLALAVVLLGLTGNALGLSPWLTRFALFALAANANALYYGGAVASEMLFTALVVGAIFALVRAERAPAPRAAAWFSLLAGIFLGLCYWTRYAGLFFIAGTGLAVGGLVLVRRTLRSVTTAAFTMVPALVLCGLGLARNIHLTGTWKGGNNKVVQHPLAEIIRDTVTSLVHLVLGDAVSRPARVAQLVAGAALAALVVLVVRTARRRAVDPAVAIVGVVTVVYAAVLFYVARNSVISYGTRMFLPILPLLIILFAVLVKPISRRPFPKPAIAAGLVAYLSCSMLSLQLNAKPPSHAAVASWLAQPTAEGPALQGWLDAHLGPGEPVLAADGQATGYVLKHPVVSLVGSEYSTEGWNEEGVGQTMDRFKIRYLVLYTQAKGSGNQAQAESPFLSRLVAGDAGDHMTLAARNQAALVYERRPRP